MSQNSVAERTAAMLSEEHIANLVELYKDLHAHPELSMQEVRTAGIVAERLAKAGYEVTEAIGQTGVVGVLRNGEGATILLRGDMDGLPVREQTDLPYASTFQGTTPEGETTYAMHACGHDVHTTALLGTAEALAAHRDNWSGTVVICAQPAEETGEGAVAMLNDGLMTRFPRPDICLGQHTGPAREGTILHRSGIMMSAAANVTIKLFGKGGHASQPESCVDPVVAGAYLVTRLQTIISREVPPSDAALLSITMFHAGSKANIIPNDATITMNLRVRSDQRKQQILAGIERIAKAESEAAGLVAPPEITVFSNFPVTVNDGAVVDRVRTTHEELFGDAVVEGPVLMGSEDFSEFGIPGENRYDGDPIPYAYWFFGITDPELFDAADGDDFFAKMANVPVNHTDRYAPSTPEPTVRLATKLLTSAALTYL
ncbi:amidohydrolase [Saxibacter everestensis]|uniref:Amidohydrolase n=1 Tax=Saxibacter everestensis TaxID=2909229 RepID=A0ABY8QV21_9MICO|nr:amidohydrolase [Brevibacteriaceae bacterium ZFBP1038]